MKVVVLNRIGMSKFSNDSPFVVISINDPGESMPPLEYDRNRIDILPLYVHDIDSVNLEEKGYVLFNKSHAEDIIEFSERYKDKVNTIVVHCGAGISRSAGVGAALLRIYNGSDEEIFGSSRYIPNRHIYNTIIIEIKSRYCIV